MKFYHKTWFMVLTFFLFLPAFLFSVFTHPTMSRKQKIIAGAACVLLLGFVGSMGESPSADRVQTKQEETTTTKQVEMTKEEKFIAENTGASNGQSVEIKRILDSVGVDEITEIKYDSMYDYKKEKGYRIVSNEQPNVILVLDDNIVKEVRFANEKLYADGKALNNMKGLYFTDAQKDKLGLKTQQAIKACLKSPDSADFPNWFKWNYKRDSDKTILVSSYVDAKNAFNAEIRSNFTVRFSESGDTVLQVVLDGKEVYKYQ